MARRRQRGIGGAEAGSIGPGQANGKEAGNGLTSVEDRPIESGHTPESPDARGGPLVSVVIPCFNAARTIERAIASARAQTHRAIELIAVDDASTDDTLRRLHASSGADLQIVALEDNLGVAAARNSALDVARGEYVAFLDADDEWLPDKLAIQVASLEADPALALSTCDSVLVRLDGTTIRHHETVTPVSGPDAWRALLRNNFLPTPSVVTRRALLDEIGGFDEDMPYGEDYDVWLKLAGRGGIHVHDGVLLRVHAQADGLSRTNRRGELDYVVPMLDRHLDYFAGRLSEDEIRAIRGQVCFDVGFRAMQSGHPADARMLFAQALRGRHRVPKSLYLIARCRIAELGGRLRRRLG